MKEKLISFLSSSYLTLSLFALGFFPYLAYLVIKSGEKATISWGIEVLLGGKDIPSFIAKSIFVRFYFFFFLLHLSFRLYAGIKKDFSLPRLEKLDVDYILSSSLFYSVVKPKKGWRGKVYAFLKGFHFTEGKGKMIAWKRKSPWLKRGWQFGLLIFFFGFLLSIVSREAGFLKIGEGEVVERSSPLPSYRYDWLFPDKSVSFPLPFERIMLEEVNPALDKNLSPQGGLIIERPITANFLYEMGGEKGEVKIRVYPPKIFKGYAFLISEFGLGPHLRIKKNGKVIYDSFFKTAIFPGVENSDFLQFEKLPFQLSLKLEEKKPINLRKASYEVGIFKGGKKIREGRVPPFHSLSFDIYEVLILETRFWVGVSIISDVGLYIALFGFYVFLLFLFLHLLGLFFWGEEKYYLVKERKGGKERIFLGVETSFFKRRRGRKRFLRVIKEIEG